MSRARTMTRALARLTLVLGALTLLGVPLGAGAAWADTPRPVHAQAASRTATSEESEATPLTVTLTSLSPSTLPRKGRVTLTGTVTNDSGEDWSDVTVAPFASSRPITTRDELALAAATAADVPVGERVPDSTTYAAVGDLADGDSSRFTLRVPVTDLGTGTDPGVYWVGAQALGTDSSGSEQSGGRARTFIPLVGAKASRTRQVDLSVVLPLRERARRAADGSLNGSSRWVGLTGQDGRLARLADFAATAGSQSVTWLVDPAVLDALEDVGRGNPPLSFGSRARAGEQQGSPSPSPSVSASPLTGPLDKAARTQASSVLQTLLGATRDQTVLTLPYGDPDVASVARRRPALVGRAESLAATRMRARDFSVSPVVAPPSGYFDPALLSKLGSEDLLVLSDRGRLLSPTDSRLPSGQQLVLSDARASAGGPAPALPRSALALRQRVLAEASLEAEKGAAAPRPVVVTVPPTWNPGAGWREADFFGGLQTPWTRLVPVERDTATAYPGRLPYGSRQRAQEIEGRNVEATRTLARTSSVVGQLLDNDNDVTQRLTGAAMQASSYSALGTESLAADQVLALDATTRGQLDRVQVTGTDFVTLSGGSGSLTVTLVNGLGQPIKVGIRARSADPDVRVSTPDPVQMQAGQRTTVRLPVTSSVGVHEVTLLPVTSKGLDAGAPFTFSVRTSQVGKVIWYVIFAGAALLAVMIVRRIVLRVRLHRWRVKEGA